MKMLEILISISFLSNILIYPTNCVEICTTKEIVSDYDYMISSPVDSIMYSRNIDCSIKIHCPAGKMIIFENLTLNRLYHDITLSIKTDNIAFTISSYRPTLPTVPLDTDIVTLQLKTNRLGEASSFNISYKFVPGIPISTQTGYSFNGHFRLNYVSNTWERLIINEIRDWKRYAFVHFTRICNSNTHIFIAGHEKLPYDVCSQSYHSESYSGASITISIYSDQSDLPVNEVHFVSRRKAGLKSCKPDFDCDDKTYCVPMETKCDGFLDCPKSRADESNCEYNNTTELSLRNPKIDGNVYLNYTQHLTVVPNIESHNHPILYLFNGLVFILILMVIVFFFHKHRSKNNSSDPFRFKFVNDKTIPYSDA